MAVLFRIPVDLLYITLLIWIHLVTRCSSTANIWSCDVTNGTNGTPISNYRTCSVCPSEHRWAPTNCHEGYSNYPEECPGFVGMNLTYICDFEGAQLYRYRNGTYQCLNGSSVNYGLLLPEHAGLYECRNSTNHTVYTQNITVNEEIRIGPYGSDCRSFSYLPEDECCRSTKNWNGENQYYSFVVYANPADNVSVTVEQLRWEVEEETRNDVDIGLYTEQDGHNPVLWRVGYRYKPLRVTNAYPRIMFRITASNANFSHSICETVYFNVELAHFVVNNVSLPMNKTLQENEEVEFQCTFAYVDENLNSNYGIQFEFSSDGENETICSELLNVGSSPNEEKQIVRNCSAEIELHKKKDIRSWEVDYTFRIPKSSAELNGSIFTCSLLRLYDHYVLQWKKTATLTVVPASVHSTEHQGTESPPPSSAASIAASLTVICVVVTVMVFVSVGAAALLRKKRNQYTTLPPDRLPLNSIHSSSSTPCGSEANTPVINMNRSIEIIQINGAPRNGPVQAPNGGANLNTNNKDMVVCFPKITGTTRKDHPKAFDPSQHRIVNIYSDDDLSKLKEFVVYISYTDKMSEWVRNELKPLIESLHPIIQVTIHEYNMIPGHTESAERQRLVSGADKIVIIASAEYATSEWCIFELEHAVYQKPAPCNGRVIPILTDNMSILPRIIEGLVCLHSDQTNFKEKLRQAIFEKPSTLVYSTC